MLRKSLLLLAFVPAVGTAANTPANNDARFEQLDARIAALEAGLAVRLFDRLGRRVLATEAGETLLPRARRILADVEDSRRALADLSGQVAGRLCVATSHHVGLHRLPPVLRAYTARYPQVQLDLRFMASEAASAAVAATQPTVVNISKRFLAARRSA